MSDASSAAWRDEETAAKRRDGIRRYYEDHPEEVLERNRKVAAASSERQAQANADRNSRIVAMRRDGKGIQEIADAVGASKSTVSSVCRDAGVSGFWVTKSPSAEAISKGAATRRAKNAERDARILEMKRQGLGASAIAEELDMKRSAVDQVIRRARSRPSG